MKTEKERTNCVGIDSKVSQKSFPRNNKLFASFVRTFGCCCSFFLPLSTDCYIDDDNDGDDDDDKALQQE